MEEYRVWPRSAFSSGVPVRVPRATGVGGGPRVERPWLAHLEPTEPEGVDLSTSSHRNLDIYLLNIDISVDVLFQ